MKDHDLRVTWAGATDLGTLALLLAALPLLAAPTYGAGLAVMVVLDGLLAVAWLGDLAAARRRLLGLDLGWRLPAAAQTGRPATLALTVHNGQPEPLELELQPAWPACVAQEGAPLALRAPACGTTEAPLLVLPLAPGDHAHGEASLRLRGPLGLAYLDATAPAAATLTVAQGVAPMPRPGRRRSRAARRQGTRPVPVRSPDGEVASIRLFQQGDAMRSVHWKASARRRQLVVREHEPERRSHVWIALECGRGMARARDGRSVYGEALAAVLGLARRLLDEGTSVGVVVFDATLRLQVGEVAGAGRLPALAASMARVTPTALEPDYGLVEAALGRSRRRGDRLVLVSALPARSLRRALASRAPGWASLYHLAVARLTEERLDGPASGEVRSDEDCYRSAVRWIDLLQECVLEQDLVAAGARWREASPDQLPEVLLALAAPVESGPAVRRKEVRRG